MRRSSASVERFAPGAAVLPELLSDQLSPPVIACEQVVERRSVIPAPAPLDRGEVGLVGEAVVLERRDELLLQRVPQPHLGGEHAVEVGKKRLAVGALGSGGQPEQDGRPKALEHLLVRIGRRVVTLVDNDVLPVFGPEPVREVAPREALDGGEEVGCALRPLRAGQQLAEAAVAEDVTEAGARLAQKLLTVSEGEEVRADGLALVVEAGEYGLAAGKRRIG